MAAAAKNEPYEFGGPVGAFALIVWSHFIIYYFWYCLETTGGHLILPLSVGELMDHFVRFAEIAVVKGNPSSVVWFSYVFYFFLTIVLAAIMPGMYTFGLVIDDKKGTRLPYLCNGYACYYAVLLILGVVHYLDIYRLSYVVDHYGEYLVVSTVISTVTSIWWYVYGILTEPRDIYTGNFIYDYFMGTSLYPRIGIVDIKMVAEARWSWLTLFIITASCAMKQYETTGRISLEMFVILSAHWLYSNATVKGEQYIPCTWDMFHEKYGWMLNFWNITGVPFMYCFQSYYILLNQKYISEELSSAFTICNFILLLIGYYIFDTANCQKASYKVPKLAERALFPSFSWGVLKQPAKCIQTPVGNLLIDGWYSYARKMQYTGDIIMALVWGLSCGFGSLCPYFYVLFYTTMIVHRQGRDEERCSQKYGKHWEEYVKRVPNVFIPSTLMFTDLWAYLTGAKEEGKKKK